MGPDWYLQCVKSANLLEHLERLKGGRILSPLRRAHSLDFTKSLRPPLLQLPVVFDTPYPGTGRSGFSPLRICLSTVPDSRYPRLYYLTNTQIGRASCRERVK